MEIKDRIKAIMEAENETPAKFADRLQINRAVISHILNGRNNPSLDVVMKILSDMDYINPDWLLNGIGNMYRSEVNSDTLPKERTLFSTETDASGVGPHPDNTFKNIGEQRVIPKPSENNVFVSEKIPDKKIAQIIIYYSDNTFESFIPNLASTK
ncbi:MAG: helix-turn-helix transcriptional regulator [Dysgonamonadaceae bacterium]